MTAITEGMTPAQFITALNSNFNNIKLAVLYTTASIVTIDAASLVGAIDDNFSGIEETSVSLPTTYSLTAGLSGLNFINKLNTNFDNWNENGFTLETFEVTGDGVTDDFAALQSFVNTKSGNVIIGNSLTDIYLLSQPLFLKGDKTYTINGEIKIMDSDSDLIAANVDATDSTVTVTTPSKFAVGQWVGITDDNATVEIGLQYTWGGKITDITGDVLTIEGTSNYNYTVAANGVCVHCQSSVIAENIDNFIVTGTGIINGNRAGQYPCLPSTGLALHGFWEHNKCGCAMVVWSCHNATIGEITIKDGRVHTFSVVSPMMEEAKINEDITLKNLNVYAGQGKCILVRELDGMTVQNVMCDGQEILQEDGLIFYVDCENVTVTGYTGKNCGRYGFCWNSNYNSNLVASDITTENNGQFGIDIDSKLANISNCLVKDSMRIGGPWTIEDIVASDIIIESSSGDYDYVLLINGTRIAIDNLVIRNSSSKIYAVSIAGVVDCTIENGGISNHTGAIISQASYDNATWTDFTGLVIS